MQVVTEYGDGQLPLVLEACERMTHHLTAAIVSNDINFIQHVLAHTVNGTTYAGIRARTTGEWAPLQRAHVSSCVSASMRDDCNQLLVHSR